MSTSFLALNNPHPRDAFIDFEPDSHTYTIRPDTYTIRPDTYTIRPDTPSPILCPEKKYTSVTTWNHTHFTHFDADAIVAKMNLTKPSSKYFGQTPEQIKAGWDKNRDEAASAGTAMHYYIECYYNAAAEASNIKSPLSKELAYFHNFVLDFQKKFPQYKPYRTEWTIYHEELQLAGSIDMVFENENDGSLFIYDWKRTKEIKKHSAYMTFALTECISHLPDTNYWHYALQLNTYKTILEQKYGKKVTALVLVVLHPQNANYQLVPVPLLIDEMNELFAARLASL
jgi:ATP-dependent exoDNAse (exonuclease V) beta subunit